MKNKKTIVLVILTIIIFTLLLFSLSVFFVLFIYYYNKNIKNSEDSSTYNSEVLKYSEIDIPNKQTTYGFVKLTNELSTSEYISYFSENSKTTVIISQFNDNDGEYECTGSCYCNNNNERKSISGSTTTANLLTKGLFVLISAFSVNMAYQIAQESFESNCKERFGDLCPPENIFTKMEYCDIPKPKPEPTIEGTEEDEKKILFVDHEEGSTNENIKMREYDCTGYCLPNSKNFLKSPETQLEVTKFGDCRRLETEGIIVIFTKSENIQLAKEFFRKDILIGFCKKFSVVEVNKGGGRTQLTQICKSKEGNTLENVKCIKRPFKERTAILQ